MKAERIKEGKKYMAVVKGYEILIEVDMVVCSHVYGKKVDSGAGVALHIDAITAGPLKFKDNIGPEKQD